MKTIGFIDYYLNEWHADNYPQWINTQSNGEYKVKYAYGLIDSPMEGGLTNEAWAAEHGIELLSTIEEVCEKSDCIIVLSPDNSEMHEQLCQIPLKTGKCVYVDKTFADSKQIAENLFNLAQKYNTPMYSTSALRYAPEYANIKKSNIASINSFGGGRLFEIYCIHQLEPIIMLMGNKIKRVMFTGNDCASNVVLEWFDGRTATITHSPNYPLFEMTIAYDSKIKKVAAQADCFAPFIKEMVNFFDTSLPKVDKFDTIAIMAIREACLKAKSNKGNWIEV